MRLTFTLPAELDLQEIYNYIADDNPDAAISVIVEIESRLEALLRMPKMGTPREDAPPGYRALVIENYLAFYKIEEDTIYVIRILHTARDIDRQFE